MAKDDYFVLAYRILKYLLACFKTGELADTEMFGPAALGISNGYWVNLMQSLCNEGYVTGISFPPVIGTVAGAKVYDAKITQKGIEFFQDNSKMKKAADFLRTVKDTIPGF